MNTPDIKSINANIDSICATCGIAVQRRVTGEGTKVRYVNMPGKTVDREAAKQALKAMARHETDNKRGAEALIYILASEIVGKVSRK